MCAKDNHFLNVIYHLERNNIDINKQNNNGRTLLHYAFLHNNKDAINYFNKKGALKDIKDNYGFTSEDYLYENFIYLHEDIFKAIYSGDLRSVIY